MNKFEQLYNKIILEANWDFGSDFVKKDQYLNIAIYFQQIHIIQRIKERGICTLGNLKKSCKKFLKTLNERNQLLKENQLQKHYNVYDNTRNILWCCDLCRKSNGLYLKVNTFLDNSWRTRKVYEI